jgi:hypothetical protein
MRQTFGNQTATIILIYVQLCIWKVRIFEGTPAIRNSSKKSATDQKRWQISKNDLRRFDSQFSIESKNEIKLDRFHLKKHDSSVFIILGQPVCIYTAIFSEYAVEA